MTPREVRNHWINELVWITREPQDLCFCLFFLFVTPFFRAFILRLSLGFLITVMSIFLMSWYMGHSRFYGCTYIWKQIDIIDGSLPNKAQETENWNTEDFEQKNWDFYLIFPNLIWISYRLFDAKLSIFSRLSKMTSNYNIYFTLD